MSAVPSVLPQHVAGAATLIPVASASDLWPAVIMLLSLAIYSAVFAIMLAVARRRGTARYWMRSLEIIAQLRSPAAGMAIGFLLAAYGLFRCGLPGFLRPASGLFIAIVGGIVTLQSIKLGFRNWDAGAAVPDGALADHGGQTESLRLGYYREHAISGSALERWLTRDGEEATLESPIIQSAIRSSHLEPDDLMLLLLDLVDAREWKTVLKIARETLSSMFPGSPEFFILKAAAEAGIGQAREADLSIRDAYRMSIDPPEWLSRLLVDGPDHGPPDQWYSKEMRGFILRAVLERNGHSRR